LAKKNPDEDDTSRTQKGGTMVNVSAGLERVREAARKDSSARFTALLHHISPELLREAFYKLNPKAAPGVDNETWQDYAAKGDAAFADLHQRVKRGAYRAKPSKRMYLDKPDGGKRPIGIAAMEDKIVQQAVVWVLEAIYEVDFLGFSYGFRPGKSAHNALDAVSVAINQRRVGWVLDADIQGFFDAIDHCRLIELLEIRIGDERIIRLIRKWLRAGVSEDGEWSRTTVGTPQGAVISPMLANVYLHYVLDLWVHEWRQQAHGETYIVRYADDFLVMFQYRNTAERFRRELEKRLRDFGLNLHPEKTRLIEFGRFAAISRSKRGEGKPETFNFLGFTHYCGSSRDGKHFKVGRKTMRKRASGQLAKIRDWLSRNINTPVSYHGAHLRRVLQGIYNYYAVPGNFPALAEFTRHVWRLWLRQLRRRSQKGRRLKMERFRRIAEDWFPQLRILHPYPDQRLRV
jgi:RNA-directed DNA polymerase